MNECIVKVEELCVQFGDFFAVKNVSFDVNKGEIFGFLGANGAGKTTTIRVLCGLLNPTSGTVLIDNIELIKGKENLIKQKVGYMSQRFTLYDGISIEENMDFAASLRHLDPEDYITQRNNLLDFIDFKEDLSTIVKDLPGGIKQEIALCVALIHNPMIVFLDEPTAGVAPAARFRFWKLIKELSNRGKTVFVTTHYMDEAENCGRIALMRSGELIALDSPQNLKTKTFTKQLYNLNPKNSNYKFQDTSYFELLEPYGQHYHAIFKDENLTNSSSLLKDFDIEKINPSLEDVFIRLVEGQNR